MANRILLAGPKLHEISPYASDLWRRGFEVRIATTGLECLNLLRNWHPDLMVMNPDMFWGSGIGVLGVMYEEASIPVIPVVLLADDCERLKTELRPEWPCRLLHRTIQPLYLSIMMDALLHQPHFAEA